MSEDKKGDTIIVGNYEVAMDLTQQRRIRISGYIYADESNDAVNARLDAAQDALDRQYIRADIVSKEAQIEATKADLEFHAEHYRHLIERKAKKEGGDMGARLSTQEKELLRTYDSNVKGMNTKIASLQAAIKAGRIRINGQIHP